MKEIWKNIKETGNLYQVSNYGNIRSLNYRKTGQPKNMKQQQDQRGYLTVHIGGKIYKVHRLVALYFVNNIANKQQVNHIDGNKKNNCSVNLEWCTNKENQLHCNKLGLRKIPKGKEVYNSKSVVQFNKNLKFIKKWDCMTTASKELNISQSQISHCCLKHYGYKSAGGYIWRFEND